MKKAEIFQRLENRELPDNFEELQLVFYRPETQPHQETNLTLFCEDRHCGAQSDGWAGKYLEDRGRFSVKSVVLLD